jgi:hypothetical protein
MTLDLSYLREIEDRVPQFLRSLRVGAQAGRYLPCLRGATAVGREMGLGWSCFALKTLHMLGRWDALDREEREAWVEFVQDYQRTDGDSVFEDPPQMAALKKSPGIVARLLRVVGRGPWRPDPLSIALAETKQAIATLAEVGAEPRRPFRGFPLRPERVREWLDSQDWSRPWGAGGQSAGLVVFIKTQAPHLLPQRDVDDLLDVCRDFYAALVDAETGAYFRGATPAHGELVNGAMKVLMALDWLDTPVHYPDRLIATTLAAPPKPEGCHLVDAIYVLHRALAGRPADAAVREFCGRVVESIRAHANDDGGFSFFARKAQTHYYGVEVSRGLEESDIQGTCLLVWALAMTAQMCGVEAGWKMMRP